MTPKQKAEEIYNRMLKCSLTHPSFLFRNYHVNSKKLANEVCDLMIKSFEDMNTELKSVYFSVKSEYWKSVKLEIQNISSCQSTEQ